MLSKSDIELIGKTVEAYGKVVNTDELLDIFQSKYDKTSAHSRIQILSKNGWLLRIKQGLYFINDSIFGPIKENLPFITISHCLFEDSYVSLASALKYHELTNKNPEVIAAINIHISKKFEFQTYTFKFIKVKPELYFGYHTISQQKRTICIADPEKAILDYLYADINFTTPELFFQPIKEHPEAIDIEKLQQYALRFSSNVRRKAGFLLDHLNIPAKHLYASIKDGRGYTKLSKYSTQFNPKWRVYYEPKLLQ